MFKENLFKILKWNWLVMVGMSRDSAAKYIEK